MPRYPARYTSSITFGPGPVSPTLKALIGVNVALFFAQNLAGGLGIYYGATRTDLVTGTLGLMPAVVWQVWRLGTYMFVHGGLLHILFNMLALWMFGAELERTWGSRYFLKYYFVTGIGAAALTVLFSLLPFGFARQLHYSIVIGASGAIYGLLLAYALYFPTRPIYFYMVVPIQAKYFVMLMGGIAFYYSLSAAGGVANATHLGGLLVGYLYLKGGRIQPLSDLKYRYLKWRIDRTRKKFDVYSGGRANDWDGRIH